MDVLRQSGYLDSKAKSSTRGRSPRGRGSTEKRSASPAVFKGVGAKAELSRANSRSSRDPSPSPAWGAGSIIAAPEWMAGAPECVPLLKFDKGTQEGDKPHLVTAGLERLASLPPPVSVVTLMGDGRCGKSTLGSRLIDDERLVFPVGDTGTSVTEGIDMAIVPKGGEGGGTLVVLDCEGGNNPTGAIRGAVDLVAMLSSTLTVQVVWGQMSEGQLLQIGQGIAVRDRLLVGSRENNKETVQRLPAQRLLLVVNGCHLRYAPDQLSKTFMEVHTGPAASRNELRQNIKRTFEQIHFVTVPSENEFSYQSQLEALRNAVEEHCSPASLGGIKLSGAQISEMLKQTVNEIRKSGTVPVPSVFRHVIFDHLLKPLVNKLMEEYKESLPDLSDAEFRPMMPDTRSEILQHFDRETHHLTHHELVGEAREDLRKRSDVAWQRVLDQNTAIGEQDRDVSTESEMRYSHTEERVLRWTRSCYVVGKKTPVVEACSVFRVWTRTRVLKKNGQVAYSDWAPSAHNVDGSSMNNSSLTASMSMGGSLGRRSSSFQGNGSYQGPGERHTTPASPLMPHRASSPPPTGVMSASSFSSLTSDRGLRPSSMTSSARPPRV